MIRDLIPLLENIENPKYDNLHIIKWGSPVVSFGDLYSSKIATLGINPSNKEFVNSKGDELSGYERRFHTLNSLRLSNWSEAENEQLEQITELCKEYFHRNPYDNWFKKLDYVISGSSMSYYFPSSEACHLDLIPYATSKKWSDLSNNQRSTLLNLSSDFLGNLLKDSEIQAIILNGQTVVDNLEKVCSTSFIKTEMGNWALKRKRSSDIKGYSYKGNIDSIGCTKLKRKIKVLGYNHNIQSSYGISNKIHNSIREWVSNEINLIFDESR